MGASAKMAINTVSAGDNKSRDAVNIFPRHGVSWKYQQGYAG
jgi:hypothetical protein